MNINYGKWINEINQNALIDDLDDDDNVKRELNKKKALCLAMVLASSHLILINFNIYFLHPRSFWLFFLFPYFSLRKLFSPISPSDIRVLAHLVVLVL